MLATCMEFAQSLYRQRCAFGMGLLGPTRCDVREVKPTPGHGPRLFAGDRAAWKPQAAAAPSPSRSMMNSLSTVFHLEHLEASVNRCNIMIVCCRFLCHVDG